MRSALRRHWPNYLAEAGGLMAFMLGAGALATLLEYPSSVVRQAIPSDLARHALLGVAMAFVTAAIIYSPWGRRSGAHINPAVTLAFWRLGKISGADAAFYVLFQFLGALLAPALLLWAIGEPFAHGKVQFATSQPGPQGALVAFAAEFAISFLLMLAQLTAINSERFEKLAGLIVAGLIAIYIAFESPLSGMSLNPARSFGSAATAGQWTGLWLYFAAPILAMPLATEVYRYMRDARWVVSKDEQRAERRRCLLSDYKPGPSYPVPPATA